MLKKEGNGWTRGAEEVRKGRKKDGGRRMSEGGEVTWCGGGEHVELADGEKLTVAST